MHTRGEQLSPVVVIHKSDYEKKRKPILRKEGRTFHEEGRTFYKAICRSKNGNAPPVPCGTLFSHYRDLQCIGSWRQSITSLLKPDHHLAPNHGFVSPGHPWPQICLARQWSQSVGRPSTRFRTKNRRQRQLPDPARQLFNGAHRVCIVDDLCPLQYHNL